MMSKPPDSRGFLGWLGRQVGYVRAAIRQPVGQHTVYRNRKVERVTLPGRPDTTLQRTVIDEVIVRPDERQ